MTLHSKIFHDGIRKLDRAWQPFDGILHIDLETRSTVDLKKQGAHLYAVHRHTGVWCACWAIDDGPVQTWLPQQPCPQAIVEHVRAGRTIWAHNATFERLIWTHILGPRHGWPQPDFACWRCTMAHAFAMSLPGALDAAAAALGLDEAKDAQGYALMLRMSRPRRLEPDGTPVWWDEDPERLRRLIQYCGIDVKVERKLHERMVALPPVESDVWRLDQRINDRGIRIDRELCEIVLPLVEQTLALLNKEIKKVSKGKVSTVDSVRQITDFCTARGLKDVKSIAADKVAKLLADPLPDDVRRVLEIRTEAGKASIKKVQSLLEGASITDDRVRGLLQYHGASTGRWSGRRFQPQNLKRPTNADQDTLIDLIRLQSISAIEMVAGPVLEAVGDILRGLIIAGDGKLLFAADYANIEGRGLAWLAGEQWKLDAFRAYDRGEGPDIYKLAYARIFHVPIDKVTKEQRQVGKVMELALGYQGGIGAFQTMARGYGVEVTNAQADVLKDAWRNAHPKIVAFWYAIENAAMQAVRQKGEEVRCGKLSFIVRGSFLLMGLPSNRTLCYPYPEIRPVETPWGAWRDALTYKSTINPSNTRRIIGEAGSWARISTYGGSICENATQAVARDVMAEAMLRVESAGYEIVMTVHDEIVAEAPAHRTVADFQRCMEHPPAWASGFPIVAEAWRGSRYKKD